MGSNLSQQTAERLYNQIVAEGRLSPGDKLPNEVDLSHELGVSRATLFRELSALQSMGAAAVDGNSIRIQDRPLLEELL